METQASPQPGPLRNRLHGWVGLKKASTIVPMVALLAGTICLASQKQSLSEVSAAPSKGEHPIARKVAVPGIPRFGEVTPTLYRGGQPTREGFSKLAEMGVNIVVDLRGSRETERRLVTGLGMRYVSLPWQCFRPRDEQLAQFLTLLRENPGKKVFVHCRVGDDRTGMDIAAYRMAEQGWTAEEARREMEIYGVNWFHKMICLPLSSYEREFPERFRTGSAFQNLRSGQQVTEPQP